MLKAKEFKVEDSNVAGLGSDLDKKCREAAAGTEAAWKDAGKKPGMQIWRIEKFKVKKSMTPPGTFYSDDSYICLNTYKKKDENGKETDKLCWDIHFWLGKTTSQDEAGTAAYKTVELDDFLGGEPVQHREVQDFESTLFLSYFESLGGIQLLEGGIESGFNRVKPETFEPRLLHMKGRKHIRVTQVPIKASSFNAGDVFVLDCGLDLWQWQGKAAGKDEKARAGQLTRALDDERRGAPKVHVFSQTDRDVKEFWANFKDKDETFATWVDGVPTVAEDDGKDDAWESANNQKLFQLSDASGSLTFTEVTPEKPGAYTRAMLKSEDVFVFDAGNEVFAWVGKGASASEKREAMAFAANYLKTHNRDPRLPITKLLEGQDSNAFKTFFR